MNKNLKLFKTTKKLWQSTKINHIQVYLVKWFDSLAIWCPNVCERACLRERVRGGCICEWVWWRACVRARVRASTRRAMRCGRVENSPNSQHIAHPRAGESLKRFRVRTATGGFEERSDAFTHIASGCVVYQMDAYVHTLKCVGLRVCAPPLHLFVHVEREWGKQRTLVNCFVRVVIYVP